MGSREEGLAYTAPDEFSTVAEAAKILKLCHKTIRLYINSGILRAVQWRKPRGWKIRTEDVRALKKIRAWGLRTVDIWDLLHTIKLRLHSLDEKVSFLMRVNGVDVSILRDADIEVLLSLYDEAEEFLEMEVRKITPKMMDRWAEVFLQFSELEFQRLVNPTLQPEPWQPFYRLCLRMMRDLRKRHKFGSDLNSQRTYRLLDKARRSLTQAVTVFTDSRSATLGPLQAPKVSKIGLRKDTLDRYIAAEAC